MSPKKPVERIEAQLPASATLMSSPDDRFTFQQSFDALVAASASLPGKTGAWWTLMQSAGAGIVGLAIGFGAQTLVKDISSGVFYLWEDAFRVGEFIVTAEGKGVVEKILLRSVRLRHPRGPIYTIPFGSLGTIQNHSRDWVKVKFTIDVPPEQDLERVRKLIKKVGAALEQDPELQGKFIQPLKSQGAVAMSGPTTSSASTSCARRGSSYLIRRKAFAALQRSFLENGIELATPRVSVESPDAITAAAATVASAKPAAE